VFVDLPLGHTAGPPRDMSRQRQIVLGALERAVAMTGPAIVDLDLCWHHDRWKTDPLGWSRRGEDGAAPVDAAGDSRTPRRPEPQYQTDDDRLAAEATEWRDQCRECIGLSTGSPPPG
jgi:hypothetical protein